MPHDSQGNEKGISMKKGILFLQALAALVLFLPVLIDEKKLSCHYKVVQMAKSW